MNLSCTLCAMAHTLYVLAYVCKFNVCMYIWIRGIGGGREGFKYQASGWHREGAGLGLVMGSQI